MSTLSLEGQVSKYRDMIVGNEEMRYWQMRRPLRNGSLAPGM